MFKCQICGKIEYEIMKTVMEKDGFWIDVCPECYKDSLIFIGIDPAADHTCVVIPMPVEHILIKSDTAQLIMETCESIAAMLTEKNEKYGDSALNPPNIFSKVPTGKALLARIDDKLARIKNNDDLLRDDIMDITGYLILLLIENGWTGYNGEEKL